MLLSIIYRLSWYFRYFTTFSIFRQLGRNGQIGKNGKIGKDDQGHLFDFRILHQDCYQFFKQLQARETFDKSARDGEKVKCPAEISETDQCSAVPDGDAIDQLCSDALSGEIEKIEKDEKISLLEELETASLSSGPALQTLRHVFQQCHALWGHDYSLDQCWPAIFKLVVYLRCNSRRDV